jgi:hypothetical protein
MDKELGMVVHSCNPSCSMEVEGLQSETAKGLGIAQVVEHSPTSS